MAETRASLLHSLARRLGCIRARDVVAGAFQVLLGRPATPADLDNYGAALLSGGQSPADLLEVLVTSAEFGAHAPHHPVLGPVMLACMYQALFDEPASEATAADLKARFAETGSVVAALKGVLQARNFAVPLRFDEFQRGVPIADVVDDAYRAILQRPADPAGRAAFVQALASPDFVPYDMYRQLLGSAEFAMRQGKARA